MSLNSQSMIKSVSEQPAVQLNRSNDPLGVYRATRKSAMVEQSAVQLPFPSGDQPVEATALVQATGVKERHTLSPEEEEEEDASQQPTALLQIEQHLKERHTLSPEEEEDPSEQATAFPKLEQTIQRTKKPHGLGGSTNRHSTSEQEENKSSPVAAKPKPGQTTDASSATNQPGNKNEKGARKPAKQDTKTPAKVTMIQKTFAEGKGALRRTKPEHGLGGETNLSSTSEQEEKKESRDAPKPKKRQTRVKPKPIMKIQRIRGIAAEHQTEDNNEKGALDKMSETGTFN